MHFCWPGVGTFKWTISACKRKIYLILTLLSVTLFVLDYRASQELCVLPTALPQLVTNLHSSIVGVQFSAGSLLSHRYVAAATNTASTIYRMVMRRRVHCTTATKKGVSVSESVQLPFPADPIDLPWTATRISNRHAGWRRICASKAPPHIHPKSRFGKRSEEHCDNFLVIPCKLF